MSGNYDGWSYNRFNEVEETLDESKKELDEGIDFKGAKRIDDANAKKQAEKDKKSPSSKDHRLALGKFRPGASKEERAEGGRDVMREKGTSPTKDGKKMFEALESTGMFSTEEIQAIVEASCGSTGYQEGGEVKKDCEKCKGKVVSIATTRAPTARRKRVLSLTTWTLTRTVTRTSL